QAEDGIRDSSVTGVQTCALPIFEGSHSRIVSERDLSRFRRLWGHRRGADLFQQVARRVDAQRGSLSRRPAEGAQQLQPDAVSTRSEERRVGKELRARDMTSQKMK